MIQDYSYYKNVFTNCTMPFAYLDLDLLEQNIQDIVTRAEQKKVRLASKSLRSVAIIKRILAASSTFRGVMSFSAAEAVYLAGQGIQDILIGYPIWHADDIGAIARATLDGASITLMIDSIEHVEQVQNVASRHGVRLPLCLDIDMATQFPGLHFGVWRSAVKGPEQARPIIECILASSHVWLDGLMGYEAQIAGIGDQIAGQTVKSAFIRQLKRRSTREIAARRTELVKLIASYGLPLRFVNGGGTGSMFTTRVEPLVTEITVGSGFYAPALFDSYRDFRYRPAAGFAIEIVRRPRSSLYTCLGGGYIASGATGPEKQPRPYLPVGASLTANEGAGEVQTPIHYKGSVELALGDPVFMRHSKAGELCEHFSHLLLVSEGAIKGKVTTYRGDGQCFI